MVKLKSLKKNNTWIVVDRQKNHIEKKWVLQTKYLPDRKIYTEKLACSQKGLRNAKAMITTRPSLQCPE